MVETATPSALKGAPKGAAELRRQNWSGAKSLLKQVLGAPGLNPIMRGVARAVSFGARERLPVRKPAVTYRLYGGEQFDLLEPMICQVAANLYWGDGHSVTRRDRLVTHAAELVLREVDTFLDIGAYSGFYSLLAVRANPNVRVEAFEIVPETWQLFTRNIIHNDAIRQIRPNLIGLGETSGVVVMPVALNVSSLPTGLSLTSDMGGGGVSIPVAPLDSLAADINGRVAVKIDVEGLELQVIRGGLEFLTRCKPDLLCEISTHGASLDPVKALLQPLGYRFHRFTDEGLVAVDERVPGMRGHDWFLTARPDSEAFVARVNAID